MGALNEYLELKIITFNRADKLRLTLDRLRAGPFGDCRITVLDNASSDHTPDVCAEQERLFRDLHVLRHPKNIGGEANYLRAVETSTAPYTWVVCDDDDYDFTRCDDVVEILAGGEADLVSVGSPDSRSTWGAGTWTTAGALASDSRVRFFRVVTFVPSMIFRTELFDSTALLRGYRNVPNMYPGFPFFATQVARDASVYVSERPIVLRGGETIPSSPLFWFASWVRSCETLPPEARKRAIYEAADTPRRWGADLALYILAEKLYRPEGVRSELFNLAGGLVGEQRALLALAAPAALVPRRSLRALRSWRRRLQGREDLVGDVHPDFTRLEPDT